MYAFVRATFDSPKFGAEIIGCRFANENECRKMLFNEFHIYLLID